ncbi:MAG: polysaccharide deacetylase family protein, partial [Bacteroidetes bacterium]|nr:polysaccharide deacetylase family protein [Bacteroidota bacterium]
NCFTIDNYRTFFKTDGDLGFDIFAATFYLLSRYEEYLPHQKDEYDRYAHKNSLAYKEGFLNQPLINVWLQNLRVLLKNKFPDSPLPEPEFNFIPTYDIDEAFSYCYKGIKRTAGGIMRSVFKGEFTQLAERIRVLSRKEKDPFDSFEWMDQLHAKFNLEPKYFFLLAEKKGIYDKNISTGKAIIRQLVKKLVEKYQSGIHPSWQSGDKPGLIKREIETLSAITEKPVTISRQHYIRFTLPQTFRHLIEAGIKEDHSMGYGSINGFRASVASPFYWYDLEKEEKTDLMLYPFCFMDANAYFEEKLSPDEALDELLYYYDAVKKVNGTFITLWHNTFLGTAKMFRGWREVYENFLKQFAG